MPKVSIITAVHCDIPEKIDWLLEMIDSVRSQTMTDWEIILIDDKGPIEPREAKYRYSDDARIRWFDNAQNEGPAKTRNTAVALSSSDCLLALDSDDPLASPEVLDTMYEKWRRDKTKIIYGNLQMYVPDAGGVFKRAPKIFDFGEYSFELAMNLKGFIPVTAMHSKDCHVDSGGWKAGLTDGLEDVEKWIMAGKRGYCGQRVNIVVFLYRKQEKSRSYQMVHINKTFEAMQQAIKGMHSDIYSGRFPMSCCGKAPIISVVDPVIMSQQAQAEFILPLSGFEENDLEWVAYNGDREARFDVLARGPEHLPSGYTIMGKGQVFQIHKRHHGDFSNKQRMGFVMNQPDPRNREPEPEPIEVAEMASEITEVSAPELSTILRLDSVAAQTVTADVQPLPEGFAPPPLPQNLTPEAVPEQNVVEVVEDKFVQAERDYLDRMEAADALRADNETKYTLSDLVLSPRITDMLAQDSVRLWTVEKLARTTPQILSAYQGIGAKTANSIIAKAQDLIE